MTPEFHLPSSSFEEIQKIVKGYGHTSGSASLDQISKITGLNRTIISGNNKFLSDIGLISGGMKKTATDLGNKLGRALDHKQVNDSRLLWREAIQTNEKVAGLVTTVRIKNGMTEKEFSDHTLYVSGQKNTTHNRTGARCLVDVLLAAGLINENDGKLMVATESLVPEVHQSDPSRTAPPTAPEPVNEDSSPRIAVAPVSLPTDMTPQIAINIQLHLPETENSEVYEKLFKALREHLLSPKE